MGLQGLTYALCYLLTLFLLWFSYAVFFLVMCHRSDGPMESKRFLSTVIHLVANVRCDMS